MISNMVGGEVSSVRRDLAVVARSPGRPKPRLALLPRNLGFALNPKP